MSRKRPDPTKAANKRTDDLRKADRKLADVYQLLTDEKINGLREVIRVRGELEKELRDAAIETSNANFNSVKATMEATNSTVIAALDRLNERVNAILFDQKQNQGSRTGIKEFIGYIAAIIALIIAYFKK